MVSYGYLLGIRGCAAGSVGLSNIHGFSGGIHIQSGKLRDQPLRIPISLTHIASLELWKIAKVVDEHHTLRALLVNMDIENMNTLKDLLSFLLDIENMRGLARQLTTQRARWQVQMQSWPNPHSSEPIQHDIGNNAYAITWIFFTESSIWLGSSKHTVSRGNKRWELWGS